MQTLIFTQKLLRQRRFLSFLFPLFAVFVGLGLPNNAFGQRAPGTSRASIRNVLVTAGASSSSTNTSSYNAIPTTGGSGIGGGIFANTNFGTLDVGSARFLLQGGTVEIVETGGETYTQATIEFVVSPGTIRNVAGSTVASTTDADFPSSQTLDLLETNYDPVTGTRTFSLSNAARDLITFATNTNGGTGNSYRFDVNVNAFGTRDDGSGTGTNEPIFVVGSGRRRSVFNATGIPATATLTANNVFINPDSGPGANPNDPAIPGSNVTYSIMPATPPVFPGANLSDPANRGRDYNVNNGQLLLNGGTVTTTEGGAKVINSVVLYYRTRSATAAAAYLPITLTQTSGVDGGTKTFSLTNAQINLIATSPVVAAGVYNLDIYFQANGTNSSTKAPFTIFSPTDIASPYSATFKVEGSPIATTIWTGGKNDNWFDAANWSNGVPNASLNALVRDLGAGVAVPYPNIYSNTARIVGGVTLYDNSTSGPAEVRDFTMGGTSQASRSITRLEVGRLKVYGNFNNEYASFIQRENTTIEFAGTNQSITGGTFVAIEISGGGIKQNNGLMEVSQSINFINGRLTTDISRPLVSLVLLADRAPVNQQNGAQLLNENDLHYLRGFAKTIRQGVLVGETRTYGNMGMTLTFNGTNNPGAVEVTRNTVESYTPLNNRYGIRRIFGVRPADAQTSNGGLTATMTFRYLDSETMNLNGPNTITPGTDMIAEPNLTIFVSTNSGNTFGLVGRDGPVNTTTNEVTKTGVRTFATFTLGDKDNPLPVRLTAFDAKRVGIDALVTWQTASEQNSKGYEIQVSTNGSDYRTLTMVPSATPNSTSVTNYRYVDVEPSKTGTRYYRLRQIDADGKDAFFKPVGVSFEGVAAAATLVAYPNPFKGGDELHIALQSGTNGKGQVRVMDMTGRTLRQQSVELTNGVSDITLSNFDDLQAGIYMIRVSLPSGENKTLKVVKQ